jgi:microcystin-dependent protein
MAEPFLGEIRTFACSFAPTGWAQCNGQLLSIAQNTALFSLLGTTYGGDGRVSFGLPNLAGRAAIHRGQGPGLSDHQLGEAMGAPTVTLAANQLPSHSHGFESVGGAAKLDVAAGSLVSEMNAVVRNVPTPKNAYVDVAGNVQLGPNALTPSGSAVTAGHQNCQPYQVLNFCIATTGIFPQRP